MVEQISKIEFGRQIRIATLKEIARWLKRKHTGLTYGDGSIAIKVYPYELKSLNNGEMP